MGPQQKRWKKKEKRARAGMFCVGLPVSLPSWLCISQQQGFNYEAQVSTHVRTRKHAKAHAGAHTHTHTQWRLASRISLKQRLIVPLTNSSTRHWPAALSHSSKCLVMQLLKCYSVWTEEHSRILRLTFFFFFTLSFLIFSGNLSACLPSPQPITQ